MDKEGGSFIFIIDVETTKRQTYRHPTWTSRHTVQDTICELNYHTSSG